jgi:hypothetical protein
MPVEVRENLLKSLTDSHSSLNAMIDGIDPEMIVYADSGWRIRDIIGHIATWIHQTAKSLRAYQAGSEYSITNLEEDDFNEKTVRVQRAMTAQQVYGEWEQAREDLNHAIEGIPLDLFPGDLFYPWGDDRGSIADLVEFVTGHNTEHRDEILQARNKA